MPLVYSCQHFPESALSRCNQPSFLPVYHIIRLLTFGDFFRLTSLSRLEKSTFECISYTSLRRLSRFGVKAFVNPPLHITWNMAPLATLLLSALVPSALAWSPQGWSSNSRNGPPANSYSAPSQNNHNAPSPANHNAPFPSNYNSSSSGRPSSGGPPSGVPSSGSRPSGAPFSGGPPSGGPPSNWGKPSLSQNQTNGMNLQFRPDVRGIVLTTSRLQHLWYIQRFDSRTVDRWPNALWFRPALGL